MTSRVAKTPPLPTGSSQAEQATTMTVVNLVLAGPYTPDPAHAVRLRLGQLPFALGSGDLVVGRGVRMPWGRAAQPVHRQIVAPWGRVIHAIGAAVRAPWQRSAYPSTARVRALWQRSVPTINAVRVPWGRAVATTASARARWDRAAQHGVSLLARWDVAVPAHGLNRAPRAYRPPQAPRSARWVNLRLCGATDSNPHQVLLRLGIDPCNGWVRGETSFLARRSYVSSHTLSAVRLPDLLPLPLDSFQIGTDSDAMCWTLSSTGPLPLMSLLAPVDGLPAKIRVTLDNLTWELVVQARRRNIEFAKDDVTITCRSATVLLADPYAPERAYINEVPLTAHQILQDVLEFTGVGVDWQVDDWLVPARAWSHSGTPISAVRRVADAIGAVLQSPPVGDAVVVAKRYPALPWAWHTIPADVTLASMDPVLTLGYEEAERPDYEGVYVSGQAQGVLALVKRVGTAPARVMPIVTDALITDLVAARQRGEALLGATGQQEMVSMTLPVLTGPGEPGVIGLGKLVQVPDPSGAWRGMVRAVSVAAGPGVAEQTITLERHL